MLAEPDSKRLAKAPNGKEAVDTRVLQGCHRGDRNTEQDHIAFKTIEVPILGMDGAMDSWKTKLHVYDSKIGALLSPPKPGDPCHNLALPSAVLGAVYYDAVP